MYCAVISSTICCQTCDRRPLPGTGTLCWGCVPCWPLVVRVIVYVLGVVGVTGVGVLDGRPLLLLCAVVGDLVP